VKPIANELFHSSATKYPSGSGFATICLIVEKLVPVVNPIEI